MTEDEAKKLRHKNIDLVRENAKLRKRLRNEIEENERLKNRTYNLTLYLRKAMDMLSEFYFFDKDVENMALQLKEKYDGMPGYNPEILEVQHE